MDSREIRERIVDSIENSEYQWRTVRGIVKDSKVPLLQVERFLEKSPEILKANKPNSHGHALFTTRKRFERESSFGQRIMARLLNKGSLE